MIMCRSRFQKDKFSPPENFEKINFEKIIETAMMGDFDSKWLFLPKLTLEPKTPPRGAG